MREVGTTNRTRIADYREAVTDRTRVLMRVHHSNFRIQGFTGRPTLQELAALGRECGLPVYEDLGSGCLADLEAFGVREPSVKESLAAGVDLVSFSGDKLLGGPQAGILAGNPEIVARLRRNPIYRALRLDKLQCEALERSLRSLILERWEELPALAMIRQTPAELLARSEAFAALLPEHRMEIAAGETPVGGGATPEQPLPGWLILIECAAAAAERKLRAGDPPVIARIERDRLVIDLRTVLPAEEAALAAALRSL